MAGLLTVMLIIFVILLLGLSSLNIIILLCESFGVRWTRSALSECWLGWRMAVCCYSDGMKDWTTACASKDCLIADDDLVIHVSASGVGSRIIVQLRRTAGVGAGRSICVNLSGTRARPNECGVSVGCRQGYGTFSSASDSCFTREDCLSRYKDRGSRVNRRK